MPNNNMEQPSNTATNNAKARWSALKALDENPDGLPKSELDQHVRRDWPDDFEGRTGRDRIGAALGYLKRRDLVRLVRAGDSAKWVADVSESGVSPDNEDGGESRDGGDDEGGKRESEWYQPVADRLVDFGLCTSATPSGDDLNGDKWMNPDVVGLVEPGVHASAKNFPTKLVAVEIKRAVDTNSLLTGFAEACAYLYFAHISWLVAPWKCEGDTIARVEQLCLIHGLGLAYVHADREDEEGESVWGLTVGVHPRCHKPGAHAFDEFLARLANKGIKP